MFEKRPKKANAPSAIMEDDDFMDTTTSKPHQLARLLALLAVELDDNVLLLTFSTVEISYKPPEVSCTRYGHRPIFHW